MFSVTEKSLYVSALDLWIDSMKPRERCYVSHGHSDHAREHGTIVTSINSAKICRLRFARRNGESAQQTLLASSFAKARPACDFEEHAFNEPWEVDEHRLTLFSAGHVLGSSQLLIESESGAFVYTGDFKLERSYTAEPPEVRRCDVLLMECTYGRPQYAFPPRDEVAAEMVAFARQTLEADSVPIFFAYSLGKAQEAIAILGGGGIRVSAHGSIHSISKIYEEAGVELPHYERYDAETFDGSGALVWPPSGNLPKAVRNRTTKTAILTGWSLDRSAIFRYGVDRGFPLSDHADYPALLRYIELAQPKKVLLNHGWRDFMFRLRRLGVDAEYLEENAQLSFF
ncbi:MAG: hypothetical protein JO135_03925 [Candidatus Eremiobacteraeota bacterium]|nr:hypothetical protein [Candidatus Eremiobacteraeota bacterium]